MRQTTGHSKKLLLFNKINYTHKGIQRRFKGLIFLERAQIKNHAIQPLHTGSAISYTGQRLIV